MWFRDAHRGQRHAPGASAFASSNSNAIAAWAKGDYASAVTLDPDFGPAWLALGELAGAGNSAEALATISRALARTSLRSPADRAQIQVLAATLDRNPQHGSPR